jgi:AcrR family transcriptional regulator
MNYSEFQKQVDVSKEQICREVYARNRYSIRVKKEERVVKNLEKIFDATLKIANKKGFQAMSMRDLSKETQLSMGALYSYFASKDDLLQMLQDQRRTITMDILADRIKLEINPPEKLQTAIRTHLYLSEAMQPWFYFSFMEAKNLSKREQQLAVESELYTETIFSDILRQGNDRGDFRLQNCRLTASIIKAILQDWYLKRSKYARRHIGVDQYADFAIQIIQAFVQPKDIPISQHGVDDAIETEQEMI